MKCIECANFEEWVKPGDKAFCVKCDKDVGYTWHKEECQCQNCKCEVFVNKCALLDIWNLDRDADYPCEYAQPLDYPKRYHLGMDKSANGETVFI